MTKSKAVVQFYHNMMSGFYSLFLLLSVIMHFPSVCDSLAVLAIDIFGHIDSLYPGENSYFFFFFFPSAALLLCL